MRTKAWTRALLVLFLSFAAARPSPFEEIQERGLEPGQAVICYLCHSGWAVKTKNHLLIFDYTESSARPSLFAFFVGIGITGRLEAHFRRRQTGRFSGRSGNAWRPGKSKYLSLEETRAHTPVGE